MITWVTLALRLLLRMIPLHLQLLPVLHLGLMLILKHLLVNRLLVSEVRVVDTVTSLALAHIVH